MCLDLEIPMPTWYLSVKVLAQMRMPKGLPFVGRAGKKLTEIIEKGMLLDREKDTYICNIVKCRPPGNRDPEKDEVDACKPFLIKQLKAIRP